MLQSSMLTKAPATTFGLLLFAGGVLAALDGLYLALLAVAALFHRIPDRPVASPAHRLAVLVPAHNEADLIGRCLHSLGTQCYSRDRYDVVVVADNCTDRTAVIAAAAGAQVLVRDQPASRGKGQALRWAIDIVLQRDPSLDAVVVVDADSVAEPELLAGLAGRLDSGAHAVQGEYLALEEDCSAGAQLRAAAFLLFHRVRFAGRAVLHLPCGLVGNGMLLSRDLLLQQPWNAFTGAEDLEYSVDLRLAGVRPVFAAEARVRAPVSARGSAARTQRLRWEGGRLHVVRTRLPRLLQASLRRRGWSTVDAAIDLSVPPLGLLALVALVGAALGGLLSAVGGVSPWLLSPWLAALAAIGVYVVVGLWAADARWSIYRALLLAPASMLSDLANRLRLVGNLRANTWQRTERPSDLAPFGDQRLSICGVPIDPVDLDEAMRRTMSALTTPSFTQVCTVNLDYLVNARRDPLVRSVLLDSKLNLADGAPVLWLGRILGHSLSHRAAGADFVPRLLRAAAEQNARVFFLGGEGGASTRAAERLRGLHPALQIAGVYEPPRAALAKMDNEEILRRLRATRPDLLLVALGHPKQDQWIHQHRDVLPVSVAMGVGCTFDLLAGDRRRAPVWMRSHGLEWLYRVLHEPRRLAGRYAVDGYCLLTMLLPVALYQRLRSS